MSLNLPSPGSREFHWGEPPCDQFLGAVTFIERACDDTVVEILIADDNPRPPDEHLCFVDFSIPKAALLAYADQVRKEERRRPSSRRRH